MVKDTPNTSLFADYRRQHPEIDLEVKSGIPTREGEAVLGIRTRNERTRYLSGIFGKLAVQRSDKALEKPVTVVESLSSKDKPDTHWTLRQAASGVIDHLIASEHTTPAEVSERLADGIMTQEAKLAADAYVRVQLGSVVARVVVSPTPYNSGR